MAVEAQSGAPLPAPPEVALAVDLDGTLTLSDTLHEGLFSLLKVRPLDVLRLPAWLSVGKARFKREVAQRAPLDVSLLPYHEPVLEKLRAARAAGRRTVLATASDKMVAQAVADHLGISVCSTR
jgi:beta-phosphoglucomutase-like phosphatase (HAD superfamily)